MKVIDFHTHIFPDRIASKAISKLEAVSHAHAYTDGTLSGLKHTMADGGADMSVILPVITRIDQFDSIFSFAVGINENEKNLISFGAVFPGDPDYKSRLRTMKEYGIRGIKIHPDYHGVFFDDPDVIALVGEASDQGFVISVHAGVDIGLPDPVHCTPDMALRVINAVHPEKLVLAHTGGWKMWDEVEKKLVGQDVYFDISFTDGFIADGQLKRIINEHGAGRILYATDSPWSGQKETIAAVRKMDLGNEAEDRIFCQNAADLLGLPQSG